jgi:phosphotransferase system IIA component
MKNMGLVMMMMMGLEKVEMKGIMFEVVADNREEKMMKMKWWC